MHIETGGPVAAGATGDLKESNWQEVLLRMEIDKFRMVLEGVSIQEKLAVNFNKDVRSLRDNRSSRRFFTDRCSDKGVPEKTWKCFTENPEVAEDLTDEESATAAEEKKQSEMREQDIGDHRGMSCRAKAVETFGKKTKVRGELDPAFVHREKFRKRVRRIQSQIAGHSELFGADVRFGHEFFRTTLSQDARDGFDLHVEKQEKERQCQMDHREKLEQGMQHLCGEESPQDTRFGFNKEFDELRKEKFRFVDQTHSKHKQVCSLFPTCKIDRCDRMNHHKVLLQNHRCGRSPLLAMAHCDATGVTPAELFKQLRIGEETIQESQPKCNSANAIGMEGNEKKKTCFNFHKKGTCRHGNECKCSHEKGGKSNRLCKHIREGKCKWGKRCKFSHDLGDEATNLSKVTVDASCLKVNPGPHPSSNALNGDWRESGKDAVQTVENDMTELAKTNIPQVNIASKPHNANESLRQRNVLRALVEGKSGPAEMKALLDDGSQPATIGLQKIKLLSELGAKMKRTKMSGQVGGSSATCVRMEGEVEFETRVKCKTARGGCVRLRIFAVVLDGNANFDFMIGQDTRNLHRITSCPDPKPEHRKVTIDGTPVCSHPCTSHLRNANSLTLESNLLASPALAQDAGVNEGERNKAKRPSNSCPVRETLDLSGAADSRLRECDHVCGTGAPDEEIEHGLGKVVSLKSVLRRPQIQKRGERCDGGKFKGI
eukprot:jgi/Bigna1/136444/aug1.34_g11152